MPLFPPSSSSSPIVSGMIVMWNGTVATVPAGWFLCDGNNGTPDLRDRFIVGATADDAGVAKTNLTGSLTQSGGSVSHHHADHTLTQPVVSAHVITQPVVSAHVITQPVVSDHVITQPVVSDHVVTTANRRTSANNNAEAVTAIAAHTLSTNVAVANHTLSTNVTVADHTLSTNVTVANHTLSTNVAVADHTLSTNVAVSAHDTLSAPQPYYALCYIMYG